jgi:large subunit ribosomal protein L3
MSIGLVGRKRGMTRVFTDDGASVPVTVIEVAPNRVTQVRDLDVDGYRAIQVTVGSRRQSLLSKAEAGHYAKHGVEPGEGLWEFRLDNGEGESLQPGSEVTVSHFENGAKVDVTGISKGKGYAGTVKRHNFSTQDATHGNSLSHRAPGSIGQRQTPGRVFPGKKMSGHMGSERITTLNLEVVRVDTERNLLLIRGAVPGAAGQHVIVKPASKA